LTGPDHLSALATLSANVGNCRAFSLGVRWGVGHSTGLLLVGIILICTSKDEEVEVPHTLTIVFESFVGVFMLLLGCFGVFRAWRKRPSYELTGFDGLPLTTIDEETGSDLPTDSSATQTDESHEISQTEGGAATQSGLAVASENNSLAIETHSWPLSETDQSVSGIRESIRRFIESLSTKTISFLIGIVHGLAGPGGVLGVIPAVQIKDWRLASLYLGSFCLSSTVVMGCFAALYGTFSSILGRGTRWEFRVESFSALFSIFVGILWIALLSTNQLENVFP
jgi:hypothetical protein